MAFSLFKKKPAPEMGSPAANDSVRGQLARMGNGAVVRHVLHYAYPCVTTDDVQPPAMVAELQARGFAVNDAASLNGLVIEHHRAVAADDFDALTGDLRQWFAERGWDYDGWECAVAQKPVGASQ